MRVAVLGLGLAGGDIHVPVLSRLKDIDLVAVADPGPARRRQRWPAPAFADWRDALAVPGDAVVVASPAETHAELALAAIAAGRHVYLEKPMATSMAEARAVGAAAASAGVVVQVGFAYRFHPVWERVALPGPIDAAGCFSTHGGDGWRQPLLDVSCHHIDMLTWLLGCQPQRVHATAGGDARVWWPDGSTLAASYTRATPEDVLHLSGGGRRITVDRLRAWRSPTTGLPVAAAVRARLGGRDVSFERAMAAFTAGVRAGRLHPRAAGPEAGVSALAAVLALRRSSASGEVEQVEPACRHS